MIIREFVTKTSRKEYICNVCRKTIQKGMDYERYYERGAYEAITVHIKCFNKQLQKEIKTYDS